VAAQQLQRVPGANRVVLGVLEEHLRAVQKTAADLPYILEGKKIAEGEFVWLGLIPLRIAQVNPESPAKVDRSTRFILQQEVFVPPEEKPVEAKEVIEKTKISIYVMGFLLLIFLIGAAIYIRSQIQSRILIRLKVQPPPGGIIFEEMVEQEVRILQERMDKSKVRATVQRRGADKIEVTMNETTLQAIRSIHAQGVFEFRVRPPGSLSWKTALSGAEFRECKIAEAPLRIEYQLDSDGTRKLAKATSEAVGGKIAVFLDGAFLMEAPITKPICDGRGMLSGEFLSSKEEAMSLEILMKTGPLPLALKEIE